MLGGGRLRGEGDLVSAGDTAWLLASAALVLFMTVGLAFFYGGLEPKRNVLHMLMLNFLTMVWLVRLQRGVGAGRQPGGSQRLRGHADRRCGCVDSLDPDGEATIGLRVEGQSEVGHGLNGPFDDLVYER